MISTLRESTAHVFVDSIDAPTLNELDAHHLLRVLRVKPRDAVTISNGRGKWCSCVVAADSVIEVTSEVFTDSAPSWPLTVAFSVVKGDRPEWTVQKLTEIGIDEIILLAATKGMYRVIQRFTVTSSLNITVCTANQSLRSKSFAVTS